jgi:RimJ/RimL family protein N-acetyltransferase
MFSTTIESGGMKRSLTLFVDDIDVGFIFIRIDKLTGTFSTLNVYYKYRGKGYAQQILKDAIKHCQLLGLRKIETSILAKNKTSMHIHKKVGFEIVSSKSTIQGKEFFLRKILSK